MTCECGREYTRKNLKRHEQSKVHQEFLKEGKQYQQFDSKKYYKEYYVKKEQSESDLFKQLIILKNKIKKSEDDDEIDQLTQQFKKLNKKRSDLIHPEKKFNVKRSIEIQNLIEEIIEKLNLEEEEDEEIREQIDKKINHQMDNIEIIKIIKKVISDF